MKYTTLIISALVITSTLHAQKLFFNVAGGMINYGGDLQNASFTFNQSNSALSAGVAYKLANNFFVSAAITGGKLAASDAKSNPERYRRNLSFYTNLTEGSLRLEAQLKDVPGTFKFTPYAFAGVAVFHFNPYTYYQGEKIYLKPLKTEAEGLQEYPNRKLYKLTQFAIPFGGGLSYAVSNSIILSAEVGFRKLFTDYLDDVSSDTYVDTAILRSRVGDLSAKLSFRGDELSDPTTFNTKLQRGNPNRRDVYYTCLIKFSFSLDNLGSSGGWYSKKAKRQCGCPGKVL
jgi:opacity protein-like surface antigen